VALPIKSLDAPAALAGSYKDNSEETMLGDEIDSQEVEGAEESLSARLNSRMKDEVLQHDINTVLFTLPARERNVSAPFHKSQHAPVHPYFVLFSPCSVLAFLCCCILCHWTVGFCKDPCCVMGSDVVERSHLHRDLTASSQLYVAVLMCDNES
jgi:hypothetical protein